MTTASHTGPLPAGIAFPESRLAGPCPVCESGELTLCFEALDVPVQSTVVLLSASETRECQRGDVKLAHCRACGVIYNVDFDPTTQEFSERYEDSQVNSPTFGGYVGDLVERLCDRFGLHQRTVLEVGCGKGAFLAELCRAGDNRGIGIDPAFNLERIEGDISNRLTAVPELLHDGHQNFVGQADFICCRHTLEHLDAPFQFLRQLRKLIGTRQDVQLFCDVPDGESALAHGAFWEVFYEHSYYFGLSSFAQLFRSAGFAITDLRREYNDQYLVIEAVPAGTPEETAPSPIESHDQAPSAVVDGFRSRAHDHITRWNALIHGDSPPRTVLWGSGSRAVAFLSTLRCSLEEVSAVVDINPRRWNRYMPGVAQQIISPDDLAQQKPDRVIVMNPVYLQEIQSMLQARGISAEVMSVSSPGTPP